MTTAAIVLAAGRGTRAGGGLPKQWRDLAGRPVVAHALAAFAHLPFRVLVIHPEDADLARDVTGESAGDSAGDALVVVGGASRDQSVRNALEALQGRGITRVLIHDGARPLIGRALVDRLVAALDHAAGAAPALPVTDALWRAEGARVAGTVDRTGLFRAQTPQAFHYDAILAAHRGHSGGAADDVEVARAAGLDVAIVEGDEDNLKLTWPADFARAEAILKGRRRMDIRLGNGFDVHAFTEGDHVWLCGVRVPHDRALLGHSDADVGMHALTDAIYGALAEGDIGRHFPPSDPQWKGAASHIFLRHAIDLAAERGFSLANCDVTLICERPKIGPHALAMQAALADILGVDPSRVSVKATTSERLGFTGREEGIAAIATATLVQA
ncbi:bifunctional 2-C-methyl-D-erythritol 4-phosphate cytidylyltransferase/2-C-methyl-D-erythritol 2,4-cyclodiphosphate synthase [Aliigemmobacter aestuarii]|uniref:Bifunctional enzyme IspD/IspF n=1 Tax=Aliigemmobacter aestuarii TaxID=1445661 RepID=A0A4S3MML7_9RHOB|nr:bifunctional 2-C-methyl-D-erythritol 4-phosphate cytidylyltransferase/2-C-methyl-D-erythritol 2,4-cyclodiphosphate synthase [Gemmobacter aestuarii]THD83062.1 bifunctional 2-C-methyl-D-erythritol 4-phosphate cytidylyltransferase/2-C-methyl-D-erythritol 2,4-cyclodiphosphate synthase [Gemmobacter aestuarii]